MSVIGIGLIVTWASPVDAAPAVPQVRITMTDGVTEPHVGDRLTYTVTLADRDGIALDGQIRMTAPPGLSDISATSGDLVGRELIWPAEIPSGGTTSIQFTGIVARTGVGRLATTACAYVGTGGRPIACASDLDRATVAPTKSSRIALIGGVAALLIVLAGAVLLIRRRRGGTARVTLPTSRTAGDAAGIRVHQGHP